MTPRFLTRVAFVAGSVAGAILALPAHAAIDTTAAVTGVTDAQTAVLAVLGAMITFAAARFALRKVLSLLGR